MTSKNFQRYRSQTLEGFAIHEKVGTGSMSEVYRVTKTATQETFALKAVSRKLIERQCLSQQIFTERLLLSTLTDPSVIRLRAAFQDDFYVYYLLEFAPHGNLAQLKKRHGNRLPEASVRLIIRSVLETLKRLHLQGIIHQDIKPENILISQDCSIKLSDFSTAHVKPEKGNEALFAEFSKINPPAQKTSFETTDTLDDQNASQIHGGHVVGKQRFSFCHSGSLTETEPWRKSLREQPLVGTFQYLSPEAVTENEPCFSSDLWAVGVMTHYLLTGRYPYDGDAECEILAAIIEDRRQLSSALSPNAADFISGMLKKDKSARLGSRKCSAEDNFEEMLNHPFLSLSQSQDISQPNPDAPLLCASANERRWLFFSRKISLKLYRKRIDVETASNELLDSFSLQIIKRVEGLHSGLIRLEVPGRCLEFQLLKSEPKAWVQQIARCLKEKPD